MAVRHRIHTNPFNIQVSLTPFDTSAHFKQNAPLVLEIGFGKGQFLLHYAAAHPNYNCIGLEVRMFLIESLKTRAQNLQLHNVHGIYCNANTALDTLFAPHSLQEIFVHFPDPWYKKRHHKRRVINAHTAPIFKRILVPGGHIHFMSDYQPIAEDSLHCLQDAGFINVFGQNQLAPQSTTGITSEREDWHLSQNDPVYRLLFKNP